MDERVEDVPFFWMEDSKEQSFPMKMKRKVRSKKFEFVGWGSRPLIEFLESVGKDTSKQLSQDDVSAIINDYVKENKLVHPAKKKRIVCDERLHYLFGRKSVGRFKINDLLEAHFTENQNETEDELYSSEEGEESVYKQQKVSSLDKKAPPQKKKVIETPKSCFAAILFDNIRLVYLKRSLVQELLKNPEIFEDKIVGSFVRIKSDPNDYFQKNSHQLVQVSGVRNASGIGDIGSEILLQVSNLVKDINICKLSDDNFTEEECEDLCQRVRSGLLKRPTVVEFEKKARILHEDITKHWLVREIVLLQNLIDRANEKGWRKELKEYMERKQLLQTPSEQSRLLLEVPKVIADELEPEAIPQEDLGSGKQYNNGLPGSTYEGAAEISTCDLEADQTLPVQNSGNAVTTGQPADFAQQQKGPPVVIRSESGGQTELLNSGGNKSFHEIMDKRVRAPLVIDLSDDDNETEGCQNQVVDDNTESLIWYYMDPQGFVQGPFSMLSLKRWSDASYFGHDFKVWKAGQNQDAAVLLIDVLRRMFPN
ncbi:uncharacterized protein At5g08430 isoform X2 [Cornus florida]|uniref:uncharacterized protein At5g08430 isoform X2 n=1 Tax=Cornus florida TaxID=4283 RepID=UPI0028A2AB8F|nr:uncharacterized protein At5g08430 isoform X2 [Cornus florida]